jgi:hypothetical protein
MGAQFPILLAIEDEPPFVEYLTETFEAAFFQWRTPGETARRVDHLKISQERGADQSTLYLTPGPMVPYVRFQTLEVVELGDCTFVKSSDSPVVEWERSGASDNSLGSGRIYMSAWDPEVSDVVRPLYLGAKKWAKKHCYSIQFGKGLWADYIGEHAMAFGRAGNRLYGMGMSRPFTKAELATAKSPHRAATLQ